MNSCNSPKQRPTPDTRHPTPDTRPTLVAVAAHADDVELNAGGTVAKWAAETGPVHIIMMTNNCSGQPWESVGSPPADGETWPQASTRIRHAEQRAAAEKIGATLHFMDFSQRHYDDPAGKQMLSFDYPGPGPAGVSGTIPMVIAAQFAPPVERLAALLVDLKPALVLTQTPLDRDPEHHAVASMVWRVFNQEAKRLSETVLRFWECGSSCENGLLAVTPDHIEDISDYYEAKIDILTCHKSQMGESRWNRVKERAPRWGKAIGVHYAEPFWTANLPGRGSTSQ